MKIATVSEDGTTISKHFGRAPFYVVVTVENGQVVSREQRAKAGHHTFAQQQHQQHDHHHEHHHDTAQASGHSQASASTAQAQTHVPGSPVGADQGHGIGTQAHQRHENMASVISDCEAILAGGMGNGAYRSFLSLNIKPIVTDIDAIDEAAIAYAAGSITDRTDLLH